MEYALRTLIIPRQQLLDLALISAVDEGSVAVR